VAPQTGKWERNRVQLVATREFLGWARVRCPCSFFPAPRYPERIEFGMGMRSLIFFRVRREDQNFCGSKVAARNELEG